ncbi:hypothetical protein GCM10023063_37700 [Arthrobacter methylotrophus]
MLREVRLEMLSDTPMAYVESLAAARRQTDTQWQERAATMSGDSSITLVADDGTDGSRIIGLMRVVVNQPQEPSQALQAMLISVYVAPEYRGLGLAARLLDEACAVAGAELGAAVIELGVHEENARARTFYSRHGFEDTGASRPYPQDKTKREVIMARRLQPETNSTSEFMAELAAVLTPGQVAVDEPMRTAYATDQGPVLDPQLPLAVVFAESVEDVQHVVLSCAKHKVPIVARGAGTGVSGGAHASAGCIVLSLERMNRILQLNVDDETAVVEPGVVNADLNAAVAEHGLMYAPDPASYKMSTIGGNVATNAGGLRCAKYGVTRDSVLALDVVLADGSLIHTGHQTFKGVAGYDLTALLVGSEGTLGIVVGVTVRLRYLPRDVQTVAAFYPDFRAAAAGVLAVGKARVQPAIMEMLDAGTLAQLDELYGSDLGERGQALLLIQTDGFGAAAEAALVREVLVAGGATMMAEANAEAERLVEMRRSSRGDEVDNEYRVGEDVAVPRSRLVDYVAALEAMAATHNVQLKVVAHAGDGNLHPTFWVDRVDMEVDADAMARLNMALDDSIDAALEMGGTITGEHGVGQYKLRWLGLEQPGPVRELEHRIKELFDPAGIFNPGKAI